MAKSKRTGHPKGTSQRRPRSRKADARRSLTDVLGIEVRFSPDDQSPPVNTDLLEQWVREELTDSEADRVHDLIITYRPWRDACVTLLRRRLDE